MEQTLINQVYLEQLKSLANEQNESSFVSHLIDHLEFEYRNILSHEDIFFDDGRIFGEEVLVCLHRLKNSFSNLGAEPASVLLDQIRHAVEGRKTCDRDIAHLWKKFRATADRTMEQLGHLK
jgi:hypothetical protein